MNNKAHLRPKDYDSNGDIIPSGWKEEKEELISRNALRKAFHERIWYFTKSSWDEANALIDGAPTVELTELCKGCQYLKDCETCDKNERTQGEWIVTAEDNDGVHRICCPFCRYEKGSNNTDTIIVTFSNFPKFCENCGADMRGEDNEKNL